MPGTKPPSVLSHRFNVLMTSPEEEGVKRLICCVCRAVNVLVVGHRLYSLPASEELPNVPLVSATNAKRSRVSERLPS